MSAPRFLGTIGLYLDTPEKQDLFAWRSIINRWRMGEQAHKTATKLYMAMAWHAAEPRDEHWRRDDSRYRPLRPKMLKALAVTLGLVTATDMGSRKGLPRPAKKIQDLVSDTFEPLPDAPCVTSETIAAECLAVVAAMVKIRDKKAKEAQHDERRRKRITDIPVAHRVTLFRFAAIIARHGLAIPDDFLRALRLVLGLESPANPGHVLLHPEVLARLGLRQHEASPIRRQELFEQAARIDGEAFKAQLDATTVEGDRTFSEVWPSRPSRELAKWYLDKAAEYQLGLPATRLAEEVGVDKNTPKQWRTRSDYRRRVVDRATAWVGSDEYWRVINPAKLIATLPDFALIAALPHSIANRIKERCIKFAQETLHEMFLAAAKTWIVTKDEKAILAWVDTEAERREAMIEAPCD